MTTELAGRAVDTPDYARAEQFLPWNAERLVYRMLVEPHWLADDSATGHGVDDRFWYAVRTRQGTQIVLVDPAQRTRTPYAAEQAPFERTELQQDQGQQVRFTVGAARWECDLATATCRQIEPPAPPGTRAVRSPDGRWIAVAREGNVYVRDAATGAERALTHDGTPEQPYATPLPSPLDGACIASRDPSPAAPVLWSPDSQRLLTYRIDARTAGRYHLVQSAPLDESRRPVLHSYVYPLPGDTDVPTAELLIVDLASASSRAVQVEPLPVLYYGGPLRNGWTWWGANEGSIYLLARSRGCQSLRLVAIDAATGTARTIIEEHSETAIDPHLTSAGTPNVRVLADGARAVWFSQRDGWGHLYLYDLRTDALERQLTHGTWAVADLLHVDEAGGWLYFTAVGTPAASDPYFELLYRVSLAGGEPERLTPEDATHRVAFAPSGACFVDRYSRVDQPPLTVLRRADGSLLLELERADVSDLLATGWRPPERFSAKARDGQTDVYGVLLLPSWFRSDGQDASLPVLDDVYAGPQTNRAPASFAGYTSPAHQHPSHAARGFWQAQALAELGFAVVMIDGLGMPFRARAFHNERSFRQVGDGGLEDHIHALRQLATRHPYLDLERVGIYGHSAGGYASAHAMLRFPEFFKVGVSSAGNHDHRLDKATWIERYMGLPVGDYYAEQANATLAQRLSGKLLLIHGEMDENVHVASTLQLVDALIKANKDFDLLILPNRPHACTDDPYFIRRRWDYFVRHLLGAEPPRGYRLVDPPAAGRHA